MYVLQISSKCNGRNKVHSMNKEYSCSVRSTAFSLVSCFLEGAIEIGCCFNSYVFVKFLFLWVVQPYTLRMSPKNSHKFYYWISIMLLCDNVEAFAGWYSPCCVESLASKFPSNLRLLSIIPVCRITKFSWWFTVRWSYTCRPNPL